MTEEYTIPLAKIIKELGLRAMHLPKMRRKFSSALGM